MEAHEETLEAAASPLTTWVIEAGEGGKRKRSR